jgi:hypothetical protein
MPNLRVISDNAIDRATVTSQDTAANFSVASLQTQRKSDKWRAVLGTGASLRAAWAAPETLQAVALPFCNLSPTATMRVRVTSESQTTNLITFSQQLDNPSGWSQTAVSVAPGVTAPDSYAAAVTLTENTAASTHEIRSSSVNFSAGTTYTVSAFLKAGTRTFGYVGLPSVAFGSSTYVIFDLTTGTAVLTIGTPTNTTIAPVPGMPGWYRCSVTGTATATASGTCYLGMKATATAGSYTGDGTSTLIAWGAQVEAGALSSYYPTGGSAAIRPLGYIDGWQSYAYDSGYVLACPAPAITLRGFTAAQAASAWAFGGGATARHWMPTAQQAYGLAIDIVDASNAAGYIEAAFLVAGAYWESATNFDYGASAQLIDSTKNSRSDAGDLISDAGTVSKKVSIPLSKLSPTDRAALWSILRSGGTRYPVFLSMFPGSSDLALERDHQVYGKLVQLPAMALPFYNIASATVEVESI